MPDESFARAEPTTLAALLRKSGTGFYIPLYQRPYRWKQDDARRLICDLVEGIQRLETNPQSSTFLGTLITVADSDIFPPAGDPPAAVRQIIDGQQRIATYLCLLGELNRAIVRTSANLPLSRQIRSRVRLIQQELCDSLSFKLYDNDDQRVPRMIRGGLDTWGRAPTTYTSEIAQYLAGYNQADSPTTNAETPFGHVLLSIAQRLEANNLCNASPSSLIASGWPVLFDGIDDTDLVSSEPERSQPFMALVLLAAYGLQRVYVIHVRGLDHASASSVFESLNTTGELLTAFETFVPLVVAGTGDQAKYAGSPAARHLERFANLVKDLPSQEIAKRTRRALVGFALSETGEKIGEQLYQQRSYLRRYRTLSADTQEQFVEGLGNCGDCLKKLWFDQAGYPNWSRHTQVAMRMLIKSNHTVCQGLLIRGYEEFSSNMPDELECLVRSIATFWLLWRLSRHGTDQIDDHHRALMRGFDVAGRIVGPYCRRPKEHVSRLPDPRDVAADFRWLLTQRGKIADRDHWVAKVTQISHGRLNKALLRYAILGAYHDTAVAPSEGEFLVRGATESLATLTPYWWDSELTIEHIAPKSQRPGDATFADQLYREGRIHRLGNLTLLPQYENRLLSGKTWPEKRQFFRVFSERSTTSRRKQLENSDLRPQTVRLLTERFVPFCGDLAQSDPEEWNAEHIECRGRVLAEMIWDRFWPALNPAN